MKRTVTAVMVAGALLLTAGNAALANEEAGGSITAHGIRPGNAIVFPTTVANSTPDGSDVHAGELNGGVVGSIVGKPKSAGGAGGGVIHMVVGDWVSSGAAAGGVTRAALDR